MNFRFGIFLLIAALLFSYLALPCSFRTIDCGENGKCVNDFNDYICSCGDGTQKMNDSIPQSTCITDYCYKIDCERGECQGSLNGYTCQCDSGLIFID